MHSRRIKDIFEENGVLGWNILQSGRAVKTFWRLVNNFKQVLNKIEFRQKGGTHPTTTAANPSAFLFDQAIDYSVLQMRLQDVR